MNVYEKKIFEQLFNDICSLTYTIRLDFFEFHDRPEFMLPMFRMLLYMLAHQEQVWDI